MAAQGVDVEGSVSQIVAGNLPAGHEWPSQLPKSLVFLEITGE